MKESGAHAVKLEGGAEVITSIQRILTAGIPVMGHLGLTPQSIYKFGTYVVRAKEQEEADRLKRDAKFLKRPVVSLLCWRRSLRHWQRRWRQRDHSRDRHRCGNGVDGQVLVLHDMLGINKEFNPRFLRRYADLHEVITDAVGRIRSGRAGQGFPELGGAVLKYGGPDPLVGSGCASRLQTGRCSSAARSDR
jgi:3-methyl-2-oxobutanoate hydroxymethyltransferase